MLLTWSVVLQYHSAPAAYDTVLKHLNTAFTVLFSMECILKIMAFGLVVSKKQKKRKIKAKKITFSFSDMKKYCLHSLK